MVMSAPGVKYSQLAGAAMKLDLICTPQIFGS
jgi:hypothetical protein